MLKGNIMKTGDALHREIIRNTTSWEIKVEPDLKLKNYMCLNISDVKHRDGSFKICQKASWVKKK